MSENTERDGKTKFYQSAITHFSRRIDQQFVF